ncbi:Mrp/NBP35 family ATP-binding protein [Crassaminicella thermophila]|uniref:Iron-sulfur cluster carrier protein n=1 Tax=Crassaminicella thermophila TaxID=2599308 RepID=A0A5C0SEF8_CRATE|nr:Mrp/NBP35 family ATP-binding protein [Crassaminicella thermophila]QEK13015.1 Mrp/NBP35 family ATP-binding protein [Crassaminicella thermophila]
MIQKETPLEGTNIKKIIAVMSGKGGVGKSSVTSLMAVSLRNKGYKVGIMDADITGPSIPKIFGINGIRAFSSDGKVIQPVDTVTGIKVMSLNLLIDKEDDPVVWRGPLIGATVKQFYTDVAWGDLDVLLIDMPPGTGDVPLTIMQSLPVDGIVVVSSPQDLVKLIVKKSVNMAKMMAIPIYGIVENMSYFECPDCNKKHYLFGESKVEEAAKEMDIEILERLPIDPEFVELCDEGRVEVFGKIRFGFCENFANKLEDKIGGIE